MYKHNNPVSINTGEQRPVLPKTKYATKLSHAQGHKIQKQQQILQLPPVSTNYADNPEPILQKTKYAATEIQPMDIHNRNNNNTS